MQAIFRSIVVSLLALAPAAAAFAAEAAPAAPAAPVAYSPTPASALSWAAVDLSITRFTIEAEPGGW